MDNAGSYIQVVWPPCEPYSPFVYFEDEFLTFRCSLGLTKIQEYLLWKLFTETLAILVEGRIQRYDSPRIRKGFTLPPLDLSPVPVRMYSFPRPENNGNPFWLWSQCFPLCVWGLVSFFFLLPNTLPQRQTDSDAPFEWLTLWTMVQVF